MKRNCFKYAFTLFAKREANKPFKGASLLTVVRQQACLIYTKPLKNINII